ncbi:MAG: hypothetical protein ABF586_02185 [Sporolactobacillus sp.]
MSKNKPLRLIVVFSMLMALVVIRWQTIAEQPAITYFPESHAPLFKYYKTRLRLEMRTSKLDWTTCSSLLRPVYLLQNFSLLYHNNRLIEVSNAWKNGAKQLTKQKIMDADSGYFQAMTIHQAEIHQQETIYGKETVSSAQLFIRTKQPHFHAFDRPVTTDDKRFAAATIFHLNQQQHVLLEQAAKQYNLPIARYKLLTLADLADTPAEDVFPGHPRDAERISGQLWEGLYKTVINGFQMGENQYEPAIGSTLPILLIGSDDLFIVTEAASGHIVVLKQQFSRNR